MLEQITLQAAVIALVLMVIGFVLTATPFMFAGGVLLILAMASGAVSVLAFVVDGIQTLMR